MATTSSHTSLHQRSKSLRAPTSNSLRTLQSSTLQPLAGPPLPASTFSGPSHLSLFLTNLRLLDLDKRSDWPDINSLTFSTKDSHQDQKKRIQCVEWALFQLFEIWDPEETQSKLRPFFPPIEQLQSLNLRAALLRSLEQAKKDGVLGRDTVLRKTMLDECKGDRLEEVLYAFSTAVLKKVVQEKEPDKGAIALRLATANLSYASERTALSSLTLAHKSSITKRLAEKRRLHANYKDFDGLLKLKDRQLSRRLEQLKVSVQERGDAERTSKEDADALRMKVQSNWSGNQEWLETILHGDTRFESDGLLAKSYDQILKHVERGSIGEIEYQQRTGLLEQLEARVREQNHRLEKWQAFGKTLSANQPETGETKVPGTKDKPKGLDLGFGAHEALQVPRSPVTTDSKWQPLEEYAQMIEELKTDMANVGKPKIRDDLPLRDTIRAQESDDIEEVAQTDSVDQFAQSEAGYQSTSSENSEEELSPVDKPLEKSVSQTPTTGSVNKGILKNFSSAETAVNTRETPASSDTEPEPEKSSSPTATRSISTHSAMPPPSPPSPSGSPVAEDILASMATTSPSPTKPRHVLSLAERTRLSMSRTSTSRGRQGGFREDLEDLDEDDVLPLPKPRKSATRPSTEPHKLRNVPGNIERKPSNESASTSHEEPALSEADKHAALIERTRKSMSNSAVVAKVAQIERRRSIKNAAREKRKSYLPKQRALEEQDEVNIADMSLDLEEKRRLIEGDGDVDYDAVFKSRPRIKTSPERSPVRTWEEMGGYEQGSSSPVEI